MDRRRGLAEALSAHDLERVRSYVDPSFVVRGADGAVVIDFAELMQRLRKFFQAHPEYTQSVELEASHVDGDAAELTTRHVEVLRTWRRAHEIPSRWDEKWGRVGGVWLLLEEKPHVE